ncbi:hypothetical protein [Carboxylicivirga marina]|uniref:Uncharacterized protein n=1 Tax=Carboxylicivirga marina TaxID=2800988 RepID=A0ABS1HHP0_9BACT|nr:hypothetical protein [Carboxylicivirga marina]MBK3517136.1 hypothetical protein [Carboxylicivirga marina]
MNPSIILKCEQIIRDLANDIAARINDKPFVSEITKKLKFENANDWSVLCSLMDVLSDTELAKENFLKFGIGGPTKIQDYGEQYLRLYGITNAIYLQKSAVLSFIELIKLPNKTKEKNRINSCKLIEFRNIVGAHTVDFLDDGVINPHQFQRALIDNGSISVSDSNNTFKEYNLKELFEEFNNIIEDILIRSTEKFIKTVLKQNGGEKKKKLIDKIEALKTIQEGGIVIWPDNEEELFIAKIKK